MFVLSTSLLALGSFLLVAAAPACSGHCPVARSTKSSNTSTSAAYTSLFPVQDIVTSWTTAKVVPKPLPLADSTFRPTNALPGLNITYTPAPDGKLSLRARFPEGSYTFTHEPLGGISFYAPGPSNVDLTTAKEATLAYSVLFQDGFEFNLGGKLPGLYGGDSASGSISCSGGRRSDACFSARLMWRPEGAGELYTYLPPSSQANDKVCTVPPFSTCDPTYGASVGRGSFTFTPGVRTTVAQRVRLNDIGQANGELQLFVGGKSVINVEGLELRTSEQGRIRGIQMQTFFGGHTEKYASPKTQDTYFSDFSVAVTKTF